MRPVGPGRLQIARVLGGALGSIRRNPAAFFLLAVIAGGISFSLWALGARPEPGPEQDLLAIIQDATAIAAIFSPLITFPLLQGAAIHAAGMDLAGRRAPFRDCVRAGLSRYMTLLQMLGVTIVGFVIGVGLVIPAIWTVSALAVVGPVSALETPDLDLVLRRSSLLTRGNRLRILALVLLVVFLTLVFGVLLIVAQEALRPFAGDGVVVLVASMGSSLAALLAATTTAALYFELQRIVGHSSPDVLVAAAEAMAS